MIYYINNIDECIVACENCSSDCLKSGNIDCVNTCIVCERVCKTLKVTMKYDSNNNELIDSLKKSCEISCKECVKKCQKSKMKCCVICVKKCKKLLGYLNKSHSKKSKKKYGK